MRRSRKMDKDYMKYAPWIVVALGFFFQYNVFVTPAKLEQTHREILSEVSLAYVTKSEYGNMKEQLDNINIKIDKTYAKFFMGK